MAVGNESLSTAPNPTTPRLYSAPLPLAEILDRQYELLCDAVYSEKGYDRNAVPTRETLARLGLDRKEHLELIARLSAPATEETADAVSRG